MDHSTHSDFPAACSRVQRKLEHWRQQHHPRVRISAGLWREAAELACTHGINRTARALRLDYYSLKKRVAAGARSGGRVPEFVELLPGGIAPASAGGKPSVVLSLTQQPGASNRFYRP
jgi:hypothetical protein